MRKYGSTICFAGSTAVCFLILLCCPMLGLPVALSQSSNASEVVEIVGLRLSKGQEIQTASSTPVLLLDENGNDVADELLPKNAKRETDDEGKLKLFLPKKGHCFVVLNEFLEKSASESSDMVIPSLTLISSTGKNMKKSVVSRSLDCIESEEGIAELSRIFQLVEQSHQSEAMVNRHLNPVEIESRLASPLIA
jgi:hypothetical protein